MTKIPEQAVSAEAVANRFLELAEEKDKELTQMQLHKLIFIANGFHLAIYGEPLTYSNAHAWQYGPVFPRLYKRLRGFGAGVIKGRIPSIEDVGSETSFNEVIESVSATYGEFSGSKLSGLTHQPDTPWHRTWNKEKYGVIDQDYLAAYYRDLLAKR